MKKKTPKDLQVKLQSWMEVTPFLNANIAYSFLSAQCIKEPDSKSSQGNTTTVAEPLGRDKIVQEGIVAQ